MKDRQRKTAAVMFTDIVNYSAVSHGNESLAIDLLDEHRTLTRPILAEYRGTEIKTIGDAFLIEFRSALDAVRCAIVLQKAVENRNEIADDSRKVQIRIGIHLSDIISSGGDVYGDGVNIAARLVHLAAPGGICVSEHVYRQVENKIGRIFTKVGARKLKNIAHPFPIYRVRSLEPAWFASPQWLWAQIRRAAPALVVSALIIGQIYSTLKRTAVPTHDHSRDLATEAFEKGRIAILPFSRISQNEEDSYLSEGVTEEFISHFSKIPSFKVVARSLISKFKDTHQTPSQIGAELHAAWLVEGSVRRSGDRIRVSAHLIDARSEEYLISQEYDGTLKDLFNIQKKIASKFTEQIGATRRGLASFGFNVPQRSERSPVPEAYIHYLKGRFFAEKRSAEGLALAKQNLEKAVGEDPSFGSAMSSLAMVYGLMSYYGFLTPREAYSHGHLLTEKAMKLDEKLAEPYMFRAQERAYFDHDLVHSETDFRRAIQLEPDNASAHQWYADFLMAIGRIDEAKKELATAIQLEPLSIPVILTYGRAFYYSREYPAAVRILKGAIEMDASYPIAYYWLGRAYLSQNLPAAAREVFQKGLSLAKNDPLLKSGLAEAFAAEGKQKEARALLSEMLGAAHRGYVSSYFLAEIYASLGEKIPAIAYLQKAMEERADHQIYIRVNPAFDSLRNEVAFKTMVRELGLASHEKT